MIGELTEGLLPWPLTLYGDVGTGKTCAALVLCDYTGGFYSTADTFAQQYDLSRQGKLTHYQEGSGSTVWPQAFWRQVRGYQLFALDELGCRERANQTMYDTLLQLLEARVGRPTVLVSNLSLEGLEQVYDYRIVSRLREGTVVALQGDDRRVRKGGC